MFARYLTIAVLILILFLVDWYVFQAVRTVTVSLAFRSQRLIFWLYWGLFALTVVTIILFMLTRGTPPTHFRMYLISTLFIIFASKLVVVVFLLVDDGLRLLKYLVNYIFSHAPNQPEPEKIVISRNEFLNKLALIMGAIPLVAFVYGMVRGAYNYQVKKVTLRLPDLPLAFQGYRAIQISDLHTGSFTSTKPLHKAVALINKQQADLVFFTGDLVNNVATEVLPHIDALKNISARDGKFSVLGNHDYGDYVSWPTREAKIQNLNRLKDAHRQIGWKLLLNEHAVIQKGPDQLAIIGIENWSTRLHFPKYGNLPVAYVGTENIPFKILLSHDPSHWDGEVNTRFPDIHLTLSGHTHGMQFGVNIAGFKWSPVQYVYKQWAGLYKKGSQYLYVNTGLGFLGYPGRVGFLPEITVFEFQRA
ncbi:metallophosphoesterase [Adhaeribacter rhizoryzae]|uniref:Metallophosphoesterase n=1 Tax=Adhaeribacter rhizoryzae TaxID=2607907 RepID=A0A5M6DLK5_9BACT|nr:metallophosphoesterase [Adhaeribacter rhizoryzae]KAA5548418.1 metallophosphoesterase [Adhaeribacter rhizoryzae]